MKTADRKLLAKLRRQTSRIRRRTAALDATLAEQRRRPHWSLAAVWNLTD